ncbi:hypothetical protein E2C01_089500 [Portunus trituberculatus]|uniref:Uncharacterized protein n=1 Tax=Portunus trituberculatus TaxID=210409 RepID=A0A5B7JJ72_PORTR|nr:hypothetical protein [Portunus trituberculatus]
MFGAATMARCRESWGKGGGGGEGGGQGQVSTGREAGGVVGKEEGREGAGPGRDREEGDSVGRLGRSITYVRPAGVFRFSRYPAADSQSTISATTVIKPRECRQRKTDTQDGR